MAKRMRNTNLTKALNEAMGNVRKDIKAEVRVKAMNKVAESLRRIIDREVKAAGIKSSETTGTAELRSASEKRQVSEEGSITDVYKKTKSYDSVDLAYGGFREAGYRARIVDQGASTKMFWGRQGIGSSAGIEATNFILNAEKSVKSEASSILRDAIEKTLKQVERLEATKKKQK